jgi:hypothetical protein
MCASARLWLLGLALAFTLAGGSGCLTKKMNLRAAETMAQEWLVQLTTLTAPPPPPPPPKVKGRSGGAAGNEEAGGNEEGIGNAEADGNSEEGDEEQPEPLTPEEREAALRDCFVDDGWEPTGFRNPTEVMDWLHKEPLVLARITSVDMLEGGKGATVQFELRSARATIPMTAHIISDGEVPKCSMLQQVDAKKK